MKLIETSSGKHTCQINGVYLHSRHDPQREAERFWAIQSPSARKAGCQIILGTGLGYLNQVIKKENHSYCKRISLFVSREHYDFARQSGFLSDQERCWFPESGEDLSLFWQLNLKEQDALSLNIMTLPAIKKSYQSLISEAETLLETRLTHFKFNLYTTRGFGLRWIRNTLANISSRSRFVLPDASTQDIFILASGPTLNQSITQLKQLSPFCRLWALPSSLMALKKNGIVPEAVISTDPGYYAREHLKYRQSNTIIISPFDAIWPRKGEVSPFWQQTALEPDYDLSFPQINGSVSCAGSALMLALKTKAPRIWLLGLDFAAFDMQEHVAPHSFRPLLEKNSSRINPYHHIIFSRMASRPSPNIDGWRQSRDSAEFARWILSLPDEYKQRLKRLNPSAIKLPGIDSPGFPSFNSATGNRHKKIIYRENPILLSTLIRKWFDEIDFFCSLEFAKLMKHDLTRCILYYLIPEIFFEVLKSADKWNRERDEIACQSRNRLQKLAKQYERNHF